MSIEEVSAEIDQALDEIDATEASTNEEVAADQGNLDETVADLEGQTTQEVVEDVPAGEATEEAIAEIKAVKERNAAEAKAEEDAAAEAEAKEGANGGDVEFTDEAITRAMQVGMTPRDIRTFKSAESLANVTQAMEGFKGRKSREDRENEEAAETEIEAEDPYADMPKLDSEVHDPQVIAAFDKLVEISRKQQEELETFRGQSDETSRKVTDAQTKEVERWFDTQVEGLGENFHESLGEGAHASLDRGSSQYANREAIVGQMSVMLAGYDAQEMEAPPSKEVFDAAARLVLGDEYQKIRDKKLADDLSSRATQHMQRAGGQKSTETQTPEEEAAAAVDAKFGT